jgi:eukaryotic-like serine/threonine-protein kinase
MFHRAFSVGPSSDKDGTPTAPPATADAGKPPTPRGPAHPAVDNGRVTTPGGPQAPGRRYLADRYRLDEVLGRGATGTVWAAYDEVLRRRVAVKEVPPPPGMPEAEANALRERTLREARSIAVLSHPNVVTLYDVVRHDGEPFVVMELLPAVSLAKVVGASGPLDVAGAALVCNAVASALQAAHAAGITHRDVKPGNVLIGSGPANGRIKLTDFGIARNVAESTMTMTGMTLGSPAFIAPEVASGGQVTPAADLWGLGATLFAAVQGRPPYDSGDPLATVSAVVNDEVPVPTAAGQLAPVISGLMRKDPAQRLALDEVRRMVRPLLPPDGRVLRDAATTTVLTGAEAEPPTGWLPADTDAHPTVTRPTADLPASQGAIDGTASAVGVAVGVGIAGPADARTTEAAMLAPDPGPLPFAPPPRRVPRRRSTAATVALGVVAVVVFAGGAAGGFGLSRWAAGAPLLPERSVTRTVPSDELPTDDAGVTLVRQDVTITNEPPGSTGQATVSRFAIGVPQGWATYRPPLGTGDNAIVATFVSPEGNRSITVDHLPGFYPRGTVDAYTAELVAGLRKSVDDVVVQRLNQVARPTGAAPEGVFETGYRTVEQGSGGANELLRTTLVHLLPTATDLWVVRVTVPTDQQKAGDALFHDVAQSFTPA